jgi:AraC-like DNA-binding protein
MSERQLRDHHVGIGYSEAAAFHRAFKRWNGETPKAFRAREGRPANVRSERV